MPLRADSKFPSRRAYVVKFRGDATPEALAGRVENLVSGRQLEFTSSGDLLDCFTRDLFEQVSDSADDFTGEES